jgi:hypothetical protein
MADVSAPTPIFSRGSTVLDYWLAHAEGMTIQPLGARVEEVVAVAPVGRAEALIVRSRMTRRRRSIPAESIAAVEPSEGHLLLDAAESGAGRRILRPSPERIAAARASAQRTRRVARVHAVGAARGTQAGTRSALSWLGLCAFQAGATTAHHGRVVATRTAMGAAWLVPRVAARARQVLALIKRYSWSAAARTATGATWLAPRVFASVRRAVATGQQVTLAGAAIVERSGALAGRELERRAAAATERGIAAVEVHRARRQRPGTTEPARRRARLRRNKEHEREAEEHAEHEAQLGSQSSVGSPSQ